MNQLRFWYARVLFDGIVLLNVTGPLPVVTAALAQAFAVIDAGDVYQSSRLEVEVRVQ